ncbi:23S rRNA (uracil(1939)-C(5))-methyltransferase RlmD [Desulfotalea psychrophila]|uniref:Related to RNA-methyltransferase n=1 Tax=Desulfotalea psychrophila (strain LSv54 / DSM 12343) TaxID=177439 RepID=Q6ANA2_DESPS|nr:23S rRNA (uracil(1939)-C(5))-methyltransferase RlmD [Desulfotalea psychrophila]CAG36172.1 related to RNA-methyltransferase [Desulfotalea psychrophila LSv54]
MPLLTIEKVINGGYGLTKTDEGKIVLIPGTLPGEEIQTTIHQDKKGYATGKIKKIVTAHDGRITPPCPYIRNCGGCNLQHATAELQLEIKEAIVKESLTRSGKPELAKASALIQAPIASPQDFFYRQRIRLHIDEYGRMGFRQHQSHDIIAIKKCLLASPQINEVLTALEEHEEHGEICQLASQLELILNPATEQVQLVYLLKRKSRPADTNRAKRLGEKIASVDCIYFIGENFPLQSAYCKTPEEGKVLSLDYKPQALAGKKISMQWEVNGFCQVNIKQNVQMIETVLAFADIRDEESVLDLFCGMGNFSIPLACQAKAVTGFEGQGSAIRSAKKNALNNGLDNCSFYQKPVHKACAELIADKRVYDCVIIDPPRQGAPELAGQLAKLCQKRLIYISCDPATLTRDLAELSKQGFQIKKIQPIDMFPQTYHIENVVLLEPCPQ